jgi:hypothetical protein
MKLNARLWGFLGLALTLLLAFGPPAPANATPAPSLTVIKSCTTNGVAASGTFNISVACPAGGIIVTGGYSCSDTTVAGLLPVLVSEDTFNGYPSPTGWVVVGTNTSSTDAGTCTVCGTCTIGTCSNCSP